MDPDFKAMIEAEAAAAVGQDIPPLDALPPAMVRAGYTAQRQGQNQTVITEVATRDLEVTGGAGPISVRLYTPKGAATVTGGLVYFHGGGFAIGDLDSHDAHCRRLSTYSGARVIAVDYRLAPEHPFPAAHDDAVAATRWVFDHAGELGIDPARIAVGGCSAGGNLAASVAIDLKMERKLAYQLLLYPYICPDQDTASRQALDGPLLTKAAIAWFVKCLAAGKHPQAHRTILGAKADVAGTPPALVVTAGYDPLQDEGRDYAQRLTAAGIAAQHIHYPDLIHDFYVMGDVSPAVDAAAREAGVVLRAALG